MKPSPAKTSSMPAAIRPSSFTAPVSTTTSSADLTIHGTTRRVRFPVTSLGVHEIPSIGKMAGFETTFTINRRDFGVLGAKWGAVPGVLSDNVELHITIGAITRP